MRLILEEDHHMIYDLPIFAALTAIAAKHNWEVERRHRSWWQNIPVSDEPQVCVWNTGLPWGGDLYRLYKQRNPRSHMVTLGGDVHYFKDFTRLDWGGVDIHTDPTKYTVNSLRAAGVKAEHLFWSISEKTIDDITDKPSVDESRAVDALGVYKRTDYREGLFNGLSQRGLKTILSPNEWDFPRLMGLYRNSWVHVGTTSPVWSSERGMKGFRDWLAPFAGCVLVYDDYPDVLEEWSPVVPVYPYGDSRRLSEIIQRVKDDQNYRLSVLAGQRAWAMANTTNKQFERIFTKHGVISCTK